MRLNFVTYLQKVGQLAAPLCLAVALSSIPLTGNTGGGMTSGDLGGKSLEGQTTFGQPWFVGDQPVRYCIERSPDFTVPLTAGPKEYSIEATVEAAIADWQKTLASIKMKSLSGTLAHGTISTNFTKVSCDADPELKFYFGVMNAEVRDVLREKKWIPAGMAYVSSFDYATGRARGFIWIAPDSGPDRFKGYYDETTENFWRRKNKLESVLIHELGHVFLGSIHIDSTVMSEAIVELIELDEHVREHHPTSRSILNSTDELQGPDICLLGSASHLFPIKKPELFNSLMDQTRLCFRVGDKSWNQGLKDGVEVWRSGAPYGPPTIIKKGLKYYELGAPETQWQEPTLIGRFQQSEPTDAEPIQFKGKYAAPDGTLKEHMFFSRRFFELRRGKFELVNGGDCDLSIGAAARFSVQVKLNCGGEKKMEFKGKFIQLGLFN